MEKIYFDTNTYIWKKKLNFLHLKYDLLKEVNFIIKSLPNIETDGFPYKKEWKNNLNFIGEFNIKNKLDKIIKIGIDSCINLYKEKNIEYNKINTDAWINVIRAKNPVQPQFKLKNIDKYHTHTDIHKERNSFIPHYTYVYYIQMPDIMNNEDGVLYFKNKNNQEYYIRPEEDDLIIMEADMPHSPNNAPNSMIDRIVFAGNVGFDFIKKEKSLI